MWLCQIFLWHRKRKINRSEKLPKWLIMCKLKIMNISINKIGNVRIT
jgi:hypothetical protein